MRLNELQQGFRETILEGGSVPADWFAETAIPLSDRLQVYRNNVIGALTENLCATFPVIEKLVGPEFFAVMARAYIAQNPPASGYLGGYGYRFDSFIKRCKPVENLPYLYDMARFEIAWDIAYRAADDQPLEIDALTSIDPAYLPGLTLQTRNTLSLITSSFPLDAIRSFCLEAPGNVPTFDSEPVFLLIDRDGLDIRLVRLREDEFLFLENIKQNKSLGDSAQITLQSFPAFDLETILARHICRGSFKQCL